MRYAIVTTAAGAPGTLASTAFIGALLDGFSHLGTPACVVGLTAEPSAWSDDAMAPFDTLTPWLALSEPASDEWAEAATRGILDDGAARGRSLSARADDWFLELKLETALRDFAAGDGLALLVYPRSYRLLELMLGIARRNEWRTVVFSTEALTDAQIDPATRDDYIRRVVGEVDGVWALSDHLKRYWIRAGVSSDRITVNPPAVREDWFEPVASVLSADTALYVGNLLHKEVDYLLDIAAIVHGRTGAFHLEIRGDATADRRAALERQIVDRELTTTVSLLPAVPAYALPRILQEAAVLVLPRSRGEFSSAGFPNKLGEYLSSGRPVVTTSVGDIPRYLEDGVSARLVEPDDCVAFADALVAVLADADAARALGEAGRAVARENMSSSSVARKIQTLVRSLPPLAAPQPPDAARLTKREAIAAQPGLDDVSAAEPDALPASDEPPSVAGLSAGTLRDRLGGPWRRALAFLRRPSR